MNEQPIGALRNLLSEAADVYRDLHAELEAGLLSEHERADLRRYAQEIKACTEALQTAELDA